MTFWFDLPTPEADRRASQLVYRDALSAVEGATPLWDEAATKTGPRRSHDVGTLDEGPLARFIERQRVPMGALVVAAHALVLAKAANEAMVLFGVRLDDAVVVPLAVGRVPDESCASFVSRIDARVRDLAPHANVGAEDAAHRLSSVVVSGEAPFGDAALVLRVVQRGPSFRLSVEHDSGRMEEAHALRFGRLVLRVVERLAKGDGAPVSRLSLLSSEEEASLVSHNDTFVGPHEGTPVHRLFEAQVDQGPDRVALVFDGGSLTYRELDARANRIANALARRRVGRGDRVALLLDRTPDTVAAVLAILKCGAAYLPLEPSYPEDRLAFMIADAEARVVVTSRTLERRLPAASDRLLVDERSLDAEDATRPSLPSASGDVAYVMYTSGSTGTPKGTEIVHRAIERLVCDVRYVELSERHTLLHAAPLPFDASTFELWGALLHGGRVALYPDPVPTAAGLRSAIAQFGVTTMWLTAALFNAVVDDDATALAGLRQLLIGGESLSVPHVRRALAALPDTIIINGYGPTETTTFATTYRIPRDLPDTATSVPIGYPIRDTRLYVLDEHMLRLPIGMLGELYIGGEGLARGYLKQPELTAARFGPDPFVAGARVYRTGDLVRMQDDGRIDYVGRADTQVKIRGFRIELGEIEVALGALASVRSSAVLARQDATGEKRLVAYVVAEGAPPSVMALREQLATRLPDYMIPATFVFLAALPVTKNGKLDARALPEPQMTRPELAEPYVAPRTPNEKLLAEVWARGLGIDRVGIRDNFFDLGGSSLLAVRLSATLRRDHAFDLPVLRLFEHPTVAELASFDEAAPAKRSRARPSRGTASGGVAIIGMAGRFPGADDVEALWKNLCDGVESIRYFTDAELDPEVPDELRRDPRYIRARGVIDDVERFDAAFFGIAPKEATLLDPQNRLSLEVAWHTLEDGGWVPERFEGTIGVFAGKNTDLYFQQHVRARPDLIEELGAFQAMLGTEKDYVATRIAHKLDLTGPALSIHTACSTSLVAVCEAYLSLSNGLCDMALAGGSSLTTPMKSGYLYQEGAMLSEDGHTRSFDARATGTTFSDGVAMVLLKRLEDAVADGDTIYGVLRGAATNNDGGHKASFVAPSIEGQAAVIRLAQEMAGVEPRQISYVEAHGTATPIGDPIEVEALTRAFREGTPDKQYCALGSVKSNVGHLVIAAGATGLIKTAMSLAREVIPPTLFYQSPNPTIDFASSPFFVNAELRPWKRDPKVPRIAGVSGFGVGGTNAHVVVEEPPLPPPEDACDGPQVLVLSARSAAALDASCKNLAAHLRAHPDANLADVAYTLKLGRRAFAERRAVVAGSVAEAATRLEKLDPLATVSLHATGDGKPVAFLFPGQGAQYARMGQGLYATERVFKETVDRLSEALRGSLGFDLREKLWGAASDEAAADALQRTELTQPALFVMEYATAKLLESFGVVPSAMIGHSVGEFVCAALAGVMRDEDAARLVADRGRLMQSLPAGSMLSVRLPSADVQKRLDGMADPALTLASDNGPTLCVVAGPSPAVAKLEAALVADGVVCRALVTSHAFHSPMMDPAVGPFTDRVRSVKFSPPRIPFVSTRSGTWIKDAEATDPAYWGGHLRDTVRFADAAKTLLTDLDAVLLEVGPRASLVTLARQQKPKLAAYPTMGDRVDGERAMVKLALGGLFVGGATVPWARELEGQRRRRVRLPTYPFERKRFWVEAPAATTAAAAAVTTTTTPVEATIVKANPMRKDLLIGQLKDALEEASGLEAADLDPTATFLELGLDSLFLTQFALAVQKKFGVKVTFRELVERLPNLDSLAAHLDAAMPAEAAAAPAPVPVNVPVASSSLPRVPMTTTAPVQHDGSLRSLIDAQLQLMQQQLALLSGGVVVSAPKSPTLAASLRDAELGASPATSTSTATATATADEPVVAQKYDVKKAFGAIARITTTGDRDMTPQQRTRYDAFVRRYTARTKASKAQQQENRKVLADPRVVTGFRPAIKELVYQIVIDRSHGSKVWDLDGNEYVDVLCGFGCNLFGWQPSFVTDAVKAQLDRGHEIGPQHPLAAECARLICEFTHFDRAAFCNTGSEAVMGCMRVARTVTGRSKIVMFTGSYHGIFDEVIVRGTKKLRSIPAAPGIMPESAQNIVVLDYGTDETLAWIREHAGELAAVLVEPIQSRRPDFQPREFLKEVRAITEKTGTVLIFDEVITGFRMGPGGAQEFFGVKADIGSYGKVVGGGMPVGVIAGKREYMDALDGGYWQFGDDSVPTVGVTYFAGTFVRHPLALAAMHAVLLHLKAEGPSLQQKVTAKAERLAEELNAFFDQVGAPLKIKHFASLWKTFYVEDHPFQDLLFTMMRDRGVHIMDGFPCFFTTAHSDDDVTKVIEAYKASVLEMQESGFLPPRKQAVFDAASPPMPGARLGRDPSGNPAWFVPNPEAPGKFLQVERTNGRGA